MGQCRFRAEQMLLEEEQHPKENRGARDDADQEEGEKKERDREQLRRHPYVHSVTVHLEVHQLHSAYMRCTDGSIR